MPPDVRVWTQNSTSDELAVAQIVKGVIADYNFPLFTHDIIVRAGSIPHSFPILTINTRTQDPVRILGTLIHEQMHWFVDLHPSRRKAITMLRHHYPDNGEFERSKQNGNPDSFWEHLIVCFNTRRILTNILSSKSLNYFYSSDLPYPKTEKLVEENYLQLAIKLSKLDMTLGGDTEPQVVKAA